jgi:hypothetical protein
MSYTLVNTSNKSLEAPSPKKILKELSNQFQGFRKLKRLQGYKIEIDPEESTNWLVSPEGTRLRRVCGHSTIYGPCLLTAGWGTDRKGYGKCRHHSRKSLYNVSLSLSHGLPSRLGELLEATEQLEDSELTSVDTEIKLLYALQTYVMSIGPELTLDQIEILRGLATDLLKAKALKNKIQRELRLDATSVKEFVNQIFNIISARVRGPEAKNIMNDILNEVIIPFRTQDRIRPGEMDPAEMRQRISKKVSGLGLGGLDVKVEEINPE